MPEDTGLSLRDLVLRLDGKLTGYITSHETRHTVDAQTDAQARGDPSQSAAGRAILKAISDVNRDVAHVSATVASHERTIQRMLGAMALLTTLGIGTIILVGLRLSGIQL